MSEKGEKGKGRLQKFPQSRPGKLLKSKLS